MEQNSFPYSVARNILYGDQARSVEDVLNASEYHTIRTRVAPGDNDSNKVYIRNGYYIYSLDKVNSGNIQIDVNWLTDFSDGFLFELFVKNKAAASFDFSFLHDTLSCKEYKSTSAAITYEQNKIYQFEFVSFTGLEWFINLKAIYTTTEPDFIDFGVVPNDNLYPAETLYPSDIQNIGR